MQPLSCTNRFSVLQTEPQVTDPVPSTSVASNRSSRQPIVDSCPKLVVPQPLPVSILSLMAVDVLPLLTIPVQVGLPSASPTTLTALVDCGACASFIDSAVVDRLSLPTTALSVPQPIQMVDNSTASKPVTHSAHLLISTPASSAPMDVFVTSIGRYDMILGLPWLRENNPRIDWSSCSILPHYRTHCSAVDDVARTRVE